MYLFANYALREPSCAHEPSLDAGICNSFARSLGSDLFVGSLACSCVFSVSEDLIFLMLAS